MAFERLKDLYIGLFPNSHCARRIVARRQQHADQLEAIHQRALQRAGDEVEAYRKRLAARIPLSEATDQQRWPGRPPGGRYRGIPRTPRRQS